VADAYDAVVLAGGSARRLGGVDKAGLVVDGRSLLDRVLAAVADARRVVVVGPERTTELPVVWCREDPPGGGPVAALAAGLAHVTTDRVVLLSGDLPFLTAAAVGQLVDAATADGAVAVDADGRDQLLVGAWHTEALRRALPAQPHGAALRGVLRGLDAQRITLMGQPGAPEPWFDCDTEDDLATARGIT
jgi:molybdopterin-guanine dinucleotide biosynthesis protein A